MPSLTPDLEKALERSLQMATERKHEYATLEHLLLALTEDPSVAEVLTACRVSIEKLSSDLANYLDTECEKLVVESGNQVHPTAAFQRVVQRAVLHVESSSNDVVTGANVLVSMFAERDSHAVWFLNEQDMTRYDAVNFISHGVAKKEPVARDKEADDTPRMRAEILAMAAQRAADRLARSRAFDERGVDGVPPFYLVRIGSIETNASIGIHGFEQAARQRLMVSVALMVRAPGGADEIGAVVDYDFVREGVLGMVAARHFNLQEALCGEILDLCLRQTGVLGAVVQTNKPDVYPGVAEVACRMARLEPSLGGFPWWTLPL
jgi:dihydroneopterin aldolase